MKLKVFTGSPTSVELDFNDWAKYAHALKIEITACTRFESGITLCVLYED